MVQASMAGKLCLVTGGTSGIGKEVAIGLARLGAKLIVVGLRPERGGLALEEITRRSGSKEVSLETLDLTLMGSVRQFAERFVSEHPRLDVLVNDAGGVFSKRQTTPEGFERTLALDYLAPFVLSRELLPLLVSSSPSRIINVGSGEHAGGRIDLEDMQMAQGYASRRAYSNAKLMLTMFTYELARRLAGADVTANLVQPGFVATNLGRDSGSRLLWASFRMMRPFQTSPQKAAETLVYVASSKEVQGVTGKCYSKMREIETSKTSHDRELQTRLWETTSRLLGLPVELSLG